MANNYTALIECSENINLIEQMLEMDEIDDQTYNDTKELILTNINSEVDNLVFYNTSLASRIEECDKHIKRLQEYKKFLTRKEDRLDKFLLNIMNSIGETKLYGNTGEISKRKSSVVEILNPELLPEDYYNTKIEYTPSKTKIKDAIKNGIEVPGAAIVQKESLRVK